VTVPNPYRAENGAVASDDPDGWRVVLVPGSTRLGEQAADDVHVESYAGPREALRALFELAEDSAAELDSYLHSGRVLVAVSGSQVIGHLQLVATDHPGRVELKNMAVHDAWQHRGVGRRLVQAAFELATAGPATEMVVATAAADLGNLRFYQRQGFRMRSVERDAFTPDTGYPPGIQVDGIELRDRVWFDRPLGRVIEAHPAPGLRSGVRAAG
jgi:ribosomal protein S18 acetylase RimI-like enzyme